MTTSALIGLGLVLAIVVVGAVVISMAAIGKKRAPRRTDEPRAADDEPTGYVPGVWLLGGDESAAPRPHQHAPHHHGHHPDGHGADAGGAHGADAGTGDAGGGGDGGGAH
jgi:hypothetical protein